MIYDGDTYTPCRRMPGDPAHLRILRYLCTDLRFYFLLINLLMPWYYPEIRDYNQFRAALVLTATLLIDIASVVVPDIFARYFAPSRVVRSDDFNNARKRLTTMDPDDYACDHTPSPGNTHVTAAISRGRRRPMVAAFASQMHWTPYYLSAANGVMRARGMGERTFHTWKDRVTYSTSLAAGFNTRCDNAFDSRNGAHVMIDTDYHMSAEQLGNVAATGRPLILDTITPTSLCSDTDGVTIQYTGGPSGDQWTTNIANNPHTHAFWNWNGEIRMLKGSASYTPAMLYWAFLALYAIAVTVVLWNVDDLDTVRGTYSIPAYTVDFTFNGQITLSGDVCHAAHDQPLLSFPTPFVTLAYDTQYEAPKVQPKRQTSDEDAHESSMALLFKRAWMAIPTLSVGFTNQPIIDLRDQVPCWTLAGRLDIVQTYLPAFDILALICIITHAYTVIVLGPTRTLCRIERRTVPGEHSIVLVLPILRYTPLQWRFASAFDRVYGIEPAPSMARLVPLVASRYAFMKFRHTTYFEGKPVDTSYLSFATPGGFHGINLPLAMVSRLLVQLRLAKKVASSATISVALRSEDPRYTLEFPVNDQSSSVIIEALTEFARVEREVPWADVLTQAPRPKAIKPVPAEICQTEVPAIVPMQVEITPTGADPPPSGVRSLSDTPNGGFVGNGFPVPVNDLASIGSGLEIRHADPSHDVEPPEWMLTYAEEFNTLTRRSVIAKHGINVFAYFADMDTVQDRQARPAQQETNRSPLALGTLSTLVPPTGATQSISMKVGETTTKTRLIKVPVSQGCSSFKIYSSALGYGFKRIISAQHWALCGRNPEECAAEVAALYERNGTSPDNPLLAVDFSNMDASHGPFSYLAFRAFLKMHTEDGSLDQEVALKILDLSFNAKARAKSRHMGGASSIKVETGWALGSGLWLTTIYNTYVNALMLYAARRCILEESPQDAYDRIGLCSGDDGLTHAIGDADELKAFYKDTAGFKITCDLSSPDAGRAELLNRVYRHDGTSSIRVKRWLKKLYTTRQPKAGPGNDVPSNGMILAIKAFSTGLDDWETALVGDICRKILHEHWPEAEQVLDALYASYHTSELFDMDRITLLAQKAMDAQEGTPDYKLRMIDDTWRHARPADYAFSLEIAHEELGVEAVAAIMEWCEGDEPSLSPPQVLIEPMPKYPDTPLHALANVDGVFMEKNDKVMTPQVPVASPGKGGNAAVACLEATASVALAATADNAGVPQLLTIRTHKRWAKALTVATTPGALWNADHQENSGLFAEMMEHGPLGQAHIWRKTNTAKKPAGTGSTPNSPAALTDEEKSTIRELTTTAEGRAVLGAYSHVARMIVGK